jgi:hypothetical protein
MRFAQNSYSICVCNKALCTVCIYVSMYLCIYVSMYLCIYVCMYVCMYVRPSVRPSVCLCVALDNDVSCQLVTSSRGYTSKGGVCNQRCTGPACFIYIYICILYQAQKVHSLPFTLQYRVVVWYIHTLVCPLCSLS